MFVAERPRAQADVRGYADAGHPERADEKLHGEDKKIGFNPKSLLSYACTSAKKSGCTLEEIKDGRAHTSIATTEGYIQQHDVPVSVVRMRLPRMPQ